jgi:hypothetical protein
MHLACNLSPEGQLTTKVEDMTSNHYVFPPLTPNTQLLHNDVARVCNMTRSIRVRCLVPRHWPGNDRESCTGARLATRAWFGAPVNTEGDFF